MCGEIEKWQKATQVTIRVTSGAKQTIQLAKQLADVEEIRLDEFMITGFNGGTSGSFYMDMQVPGFTDAFVSNETKRGTLLGLDVLNPKTYYSRPKVLYKSHPVTMNQFLFELMLPNGSTPALTEGIFIFTVVQRKPLEEQEEYRNFINKLEFPSRKDPGRGYFNPGGALK